MNETLREELEVVTDTLLQLLSSFDDIQLNTVALSGGWTAGQVAQHVKKSDAFILTALNSQGKTTHRQPDERVNDIKTMFLDFNKKFKSPPEIVPENKVFGRNEVLGNLMSTRAKIDHIIKFFDLTEICISPIFGEVTRLELIHFIISHTHRHIHQLKNIRLLLTNKYQTML